RVKLRRIARKTWEFFERFVTADDHGLPPDNYQEEPKGELARRTSPTNIGLSLAANLAAHDFGYVSLARTLDRTELALSTLDDTPADLTGWADWCERLAAAAGAVAPAVMPQPLMGRRWSEQLKAQVADLRAELKALAPWADALRALRDDPACRPAGDPALAE